MRQRAPANAPTVPHTAPSAKPPAMRTRENPTRAQNAGWGTISTRRASTAAGPGSKSSLPRAIAASCQIASQKAPAQRAGRRLGRSPFAPVRPSRSARSDVCRLLMDLDMLG